MDYLSVGELAAIESRFGAFWTWFDGVIDGAGYEAAAARTGMSLIQRDVRRLIEQARAYSEGGRSDAA